MFKIDQLTAANEAALSQLSHFAQLSLASVERFTQLGLEAARQNVEQATAHAQALAGARDVHEVIALNSAAIEPVVKRAYAYSRSAYEVAAASNQEAKRVLGAQAAEYNRAALAALEEAFKHAPAGSEAVVENVRSAMAAARSAYDNLASINQQVYATVENAVEGQVAATRTAKPKSKAKKR